ncbi:hypothetical protein KCU99_g9711, partial [Aureobasidium melanogenum]
MKSIVIATVITTLVAAVPPPPVSSDQPATGLAVATSDKGPCYKQCRNHCLKVYSVLLTSPATAPWVIWHCKKKCKRNCSYEFDGSDEGDVTDDDDDGDSEDVAIDFASMVEANGTIEVDVEKLKEALNMDMVD